MYEYRRLLAVLGAGSAILTVWKTLLQASAIARTRKLMALDQAMSRDLTITYRGSSFRVPAHSMDRLLNAGVDDSYTFGTIREMFAGDVYLRAFRPGLRCDRVLDLGCNRSFFSLIARKALGARTILGVEPQQKYAPVQQLLAQQNGVQAPEVYWKMAGSAAQEQADSAFVSVGTLLRDHQLDHIDFAKIDIEGGEADIFSDPGWLAVTDNIAMELHPMFVDVSPVFHALQAGGFTILPTDQFGHRCDFKDAMFLYASRNGSLLPA